MQESTIKRHALLSKDKKYRYSLKRIWDKDKPKVLFIMLNPSLADNYKDDPTIRRLIKFAKLYGYGGFYVGNLFSYITPYPSELLDKDLMFSKKNIHEIKKYTWQKQHLSNQTGSENSYHPKKNKNAVRRTTGSSNRLV